MNDFNAIEQTKRQFGVQWIKADSGNTYLCPVGALDGIDNPSEQQLAERCVNESNDPHNH